MPRALLKLRVGLREPGVEIRGAPPPLRPLPPALPALKVRSETQYLQAYLSPGAPYAPFPSSPFPSRLLRNLAPRRLRYHRGLLLISELKALIIQAVPAPVCLSGLAQLDR